MVVMKKWNLPPECPPKIKNRHGEFYISFHAMQQFYKRMLKVRPDLEPEKRESVFWFYKKFKLYLSRAEEMERRNSVRQIISHEFKVARYFVNKYVPWVFVVEDNAILTCYPYEREKALYRPIKK
jgi:hypothetical protein